MGPASTNNVVATPELVSGWPLQLGLHQRLHLLFLALREHFGGSSLCLLQAWLHYPADGSLAHAADKLYAEPTLLLMGDPAFWDFRRQSCSSLLDGGMSMPGRVWKTGSVQVAQNMNIIPTCLHPRSKLRDDTLSRLAEVVYIPVFDHGGSSRLPGGGGSSSVVVVLEALLSVSSTDPMLVADFISYVGGILTALQLSLSSSVPEPIGRSRLAHRRYRQQARESDSGCQAAAEGAPRDVAVPATDAHSHKRHGVQPANFDGSVACATAEDIYAAAGGNDAPAAAGSAHMAQASVPPPCKMRRVSSVHHSGSVFNLDQLQVSGSAVGGHATPVVS